MWWDQHIESQRVCLDCGLPLAWWMLSAVRCEPCTQAYWAALSEQEKMERGMLARLNEVRRHFGAPGDWRLGDMAYDL